MVRGHRLGWGQGRRGFMEYARRGAPRRIRRDEAMSQTQSPEAADGSIGEALSGAAIQAAARDPQRLEQLYADARRAKETDHFVAELEARYQQTPDNVLPAASHYRLPKATRHHNRLRDPDW